jgi:hypothetical protein
LQPTKKPFGQQQFCQYRSGATPMTKKQKKFGTTCHSQTVRPDEFAEKTPKMKPKTFFVKMNA